MAESFCIAVDAMGGDFGPRVTIPAITSAARRYPDLRFRLVGDEQVIRAELSHCGSYRDDQIMIHHAETVVAMDERPSYSIRHRKNSSMYIALQLVHSGDADACISAGNTGALMALGRIILRTLPGIDRPAIISAVPTDTGHCYLLDLGANVDCSAEHLLQFAIMGSVMVQAVESKPDPSVALLNIGKEEIKGNEQVKLASRLIAEQGGLNYIGYIEGDEVFSGRADVIVCDGFTGNVALKSNEGLARLLASKLHQSFTRSLYRKLLGFLARPILQELQQQIDPGRRNGASLLGLQGIVIKSHGGAVQQHFECAIDQALAEIRMNVPTRITEQLESHFEAGNTHH